MRPGRLCRRVHVPPLGVRQAEAVYERLTGVVRELEGDMTLAEVYRLARDSGWKPKPAKRGVGFNVSDRVPRPMSFDEYD